MSSTASALIMLAAVGVGGYLLYQRIQAETKAQNNAVELNNVLLYADNSELPGYAFRQSDGTNEDWSRKLHALYDMKFGVGKW